MRRSWILVFAATLAHGQVVVIRTSTLLDGKGHVLKNTDLVIEGGRIARVGEANGKAAIDLTGLTVMPGWIDTHVHATWYFNQDGRAGAGRARIESDAAAGGAVRGGESLCDPHGRVHHRAERRVRSWMAICARRSRAGAIPGPRMLTSLAADQREHRDARRSPRVRAEDESRRRGRGQAVCHGEHPRRRQDDDDAMSR